MSDASTIFPVSRERHKDFGWRRFSDYNFAAGTTFAPLADGEFAKAAIHLPLAFIQQGPTWQLVALFGLLPGQNLFVAPQGHWIAGYIPAHLRSYPFRIGRAEGSNDAVFCIDESSGLLVRRGGEALFDAAGQLTQAALDVWSFIVEVARGEMRLSTICGHLGELGLLEPWPLTIRNGEDVQQVDGLFRLSEAKLNGLDDAAFAAIRRNGALSIAYAQLFSTGHIDKLVEMAASRPKPVSRPAHTPSSPQRAEPSGLPFGQNIDIDWSKVKF
ncbi:SapC family protein [Aureimonas ureilytica]|uniref:SapC family protein n=1 Tax=Aureimonas ureilytica TaxID=401562 RepID=UPI000734FE6A|nr:SapC family protein [Aureimonas ureilytica]